MNRFWNNTEKRIKVKICNIKSLETASIVSELSIDALGMHLWKTEDPETKERIFSQITRFIDPTISKWLLTDIKDLDSIDRIIETINIDTFQLQREYSPKEVESVRAIVNKKERGIKIVKSVSTESNNLEQIVAKANEVADFCDAILLDSRDSGGSGKLNNLPLCRLVVNRLSIPVILAGGLDAQNILGAIHEVIPYGVDVESGVESIIGYNEGKKIKVKSIEKMKSFIDQVGAFT